MLNRERFLAHIERLPVALPPAAVQQNIEENVGSNFALCDALEALLVAARGLHGEFAAVAVHHL